MEAVATTGELAWQDAILKSVAESEQSNLDDQSSLWTHSGFFAVLEFMRAFRVLKLDLEQRNLDEDQQYFLRLLKETQQWKLNFGYPTYRERFLDVAQIAAATIKPSSTVDSQFLERSFLDSIYDLITDWGAPVIKAAGA